VIVTKSPIHIIPPTIYEAFSILCPPPFRYLGRPFAHQQSNTAHCRREIGLGRRGMKESASILPFDLSTTSRRSHGYPWFAPRINPNTSLPTSDRAPSEELEVSKVPIRSQIHKPMVVRYLYYPSDSVQTRTGQYLQYRGIRAFDYNGSTIADRARTSTK
jgi:hypothetical protein